MAALTNQMLVFGFLGFLYPKFPDALRAAYLKVHVFFGTAIFLLAIAACLTGITEKALWTIGSVYGNLPPVALLVNCLGVALVLHGGVTYFLTTNDSFKQTASSEEHQELLDRSKQ
ncbi:Hypothetical predicted protein [Paramuricea clavata]|uniref:Uncharacterized protein n=1 Tax=Paramuricea clavata TaxID=317549 RepID=A0A6S7H9G8_PARCT|nr:Hypothetical predicted protein [Paramuricea clavata]